MGRPSTVSCFKIISCGSSDSVDRDDLQAPEIKGSSDKRGWSFRKRSARHRVLSNSVTSEATSANKASPDSATVSYQTEPSSVAVEKASVVQWMEEKTQQSTPVDSKVPEPPPAPAPEDVTTDAGPDESVVITIQAAIRGFLARRMLLKHKNIIKLQAAVRGHIERRHAVGSLRCVQAIAKMQVLVRQRRARLLLKESMNGKENQVSVDLGKDYSKTKPHVTYTSMEKLLSNRFARQLLESKPRTKTINIKCDPSKSDFAWKWLERWMSISSMGNQPSVQPETTLELQEGKKAEKLDCDLENEISLQDNSESRDFKSNIEESATPSKSDENVSTYDVDNFDSDACHQTLSSECEKPSQNTGEAKSSNDNLESLSGEATKADTVSVMEPDLLDRSEVENEQHMQHAEQPAPEEPETDGKKVLLVSRKATNPAFIAAQSKFEELSQSANPGRSVSPSNPESGLSSSNDAVYLTREIAPAENSVLHTTGVEVGGSECGTELSISSTLDSPDRPDIGAVNDVKENINNVEDGNNSTDSYLNLAVNSEVESPVPERDLAYSNSVGQGKHDNKAGIKFGNDSSAKLLESNSSRTDQNPGTTRTGLQMQLESETNDQGSKSSAEASPRSRVTVPESQETPSSQVSMKMKKNSGGNSGSTKRRLESSGKGYPSDADQNSASKNSSEQLPKDHRSGKRRNSFGSTKTDHGDHEPRDTSSTLPSYMQATESARAKALANSSPKLSPDVVDKDFNIKKRHSLPNTGVNTRQGSPRVQQSASPAQQGTKGNGIHSPQERKWRR